ncbi:iron chaperone [Flavobacterium terrigena]|uniref:Uncharacterized conserved protein YdhG, YjbR/CyaY-like superfamily, DUF1801 family n=1 Tax=Flavobacterium terrigena TaxID=402734 RepID=A0A1H6UJ21_9FLAO|nr:DUF1801 domain-containing protein [Flavobacterium terrigena]SEI88165.1 Uncharacterized conserved protein YdhG, YjbR/CyaY-like superfamily, DUF1801 family [Flavobacterium terrigena]
MIKNDFKTIDEYIAIQPAEIAVLFEKVRATIKKVAPEATETISYAIPTFKLHGNLVHFANFKNHIGFYPGASGVEHFKDELTNYNFSKGTIQFQLSEPIPYDLIEKITKFRVEENLKLSIIKNKKK